MKKKFIWILKMGVYYSFLGLVLQGVLVNVLLCVTPTEGQNNNYTKISVNAASVTLEQVFHIIEQKTNIKFSYVHGEIPLDEKMMVDLNDEKLDKVLEVLAREYYLDFQKVDNLIIVKSALADNEKNTLRGIVSDSLNRNPLIGANVYLVSTGFGAATDLEGFYRISNIPSGKYKLRISYIGYITQETEIVLAGGRIYELSIQLKPAEVLGREVVVTAQIRGQAAAINQQISANTMVNVVSADKIRELPDANAAESIGRLPGISLTRSGGEANKVVVRGLEPKFNSVSINGVKVPSNDLSDRSVDLSMISSDILDGIEVFKSTTPDMDADNIGGVINLRIKKAPQERNIRLKLGANFNNLKSDYSIPSGVAEYSDRFFDGSLGIVATINYEELNRSAESFSGGWSRVGLRDPVTGKIKFVGTTITVANTDEIRKRWGGGFTLDYEINNGTIWFTNFFSSTKRDLFRLGKNYNPPSDQIQWSISDNEIQLNGLSSSLNGELNALGMDIDWVISRYFVESNDIYSWSQNWTEGTPFDKSILNPEDPSTYAIAADNNLDKMTLGANSFSPDTSKQTDYSAALNINIPVSLGSDVAGFIKFGGKFIRSDRERENYSRGKNTYYQGGNYTVEAQKYWDTPLILVNRDKISIRNFIVSDVDNIQIVNNEYNLFPLISREITREWGRKQLPSFLEDQFRIVDNYDLTETVTSAYIMSKLSLGQFLSIIPGIRYEYSNNRYSSYKVTANEGLGGAFSKTDTTRTRDYMYFFPHLHVKIKPLNWFDLRVSISKSIARPNYSWISPWTEIRQANATIRRGNPDLIETKSWNYDVSLSVYDNSFGLITISGFYKQLKDIFYSKESKLYKKEDIERLKIPGREGGYTMTSYANSPNASIRGFEVDLQTRLSVLPGIPDFLKGFVFNANYARIWSETYFPDFNFAANVDYTTYPPKITYTYNEFERKGPMPGQAEQIANLSFGYDIAGLSARISLVYQGSSLRSIGTIAETDGYNDAFWRWDTSVRYRISGQISFYFNLVNIGGQPDRAFVYDDIYPTSRTYYGMEAKGGIELEL